MRLGDSTESAKDDDLSQSHEGSTNSDELDHKELDHNEQELFDTLHNPQFCHRDWDPVMQSEGRGTSVRTLPRTGSRWQEYEEPVHRNDSGTEDDNGEEGKYVTVLPSGKRRRAPSAAHENSGQRKVPGREEAGCSSRNGRKDGCGGEDSTRY